MPIVGKYSDQSSCMAFDNVLCQKQRQFIYDVQIVVRHIILLSDIICEPVNLMNRIVTEFAIDQAAIRTRAARFNVFPFSANQRERAGQICSIRWSRSSIERPSRVDRKLKLSGPSSFSKSTSTRVANEARRSTW